MIKLSLIMSMIFFSFCSNTQVKSTVFSFEDYLLIVKNHHPIAYQANLKTETGKAKMKKAKGGFDPKIEGEMYQKYFNGTHYYSYLNSGLKIPTWFGVSFQGGYGNTDGTYINSESKTPNNGLWYAGITLNLGKGLMMDQRRAELKQANIYVHSTFVEQKLMLNQLIFDASHSYWNWYKAYNKVKVYKTAVKNAKVRFEGVKRSAYFGEKAFVDTLKAIIQVQIRQLKLEKSELELANKKSLLETFLWQDGFVPLVLDSILTPELYTASVLNKPHLISISDLDTLINKHPEMIYYRYNIDMLRIDYRLKKENLKPTIQLKYNSLSTPVNQNVLGDYSLNNYNWGAKVSYPIFTRKERGNLQLSEIKIKENESQLINKKASINYKLITTYTTWNSIANQVKIYSETVENYNTLYKSESTLFNIGESSLFLLNYREQELINAQIKIINLLFSNNIAKVNWNYQTVSY